MNQNRYIITFVLASVVVACLTLQSRGQVYINDAATCSAECAAPYWDAPESTG